ncbi:GTPase ObgE [Yanshouia hominis]|uniref:GTPase Obg n=1 Tax=Yanshouia hominis TaxID=2763673 RepID=A0ABR7NL76_9FIRM|nr:GTPase ObgE [Yanshouia hominis]MBC8576597.1 GTPase ObgE [Yanshouia hominis]
MFVDQAFIRVRAGKGGDGAVSFHREKYVAAGGPDGGDGGRGGNVIFVADTNKTTLMEFKYKTKYIAPDGEPGRARQCSGRAAEDLLVRVPLGTLVREKESGRLLADLSDGEPVVIARGGRGGWGNQHFATPTRQIPRFSKPGLPGEEFDLKLELKLLADVGLVGFPNVGKSTLVSMVSAAKPKIANYHFTTLTPVLGVVRIDSEKSFVMADIPGLIEGASEGVGLGHEFLRHVERCRLMVHIVDVSGCEGRDPIEDFDLINRELQNFSEDLAQRPMLVAANKCDIATEAQIEAFQGEIERRGYRFFPISAATRSGVDALIDAVAAALDELPPVLRYEPDPLPMEEAAPGDSRRFEITRGDDGIYYIKADWMPRILASVNMDDYESLQYLQRTLQNTGIIDRLEEMGIQENDTVDIDGFEFDYLR